MATFGAFRPLGTNPRGTPPNFVLFRPCLLLDALFNPIFVLACVDI